MSQKDSKPDLRQMSSTKNRTASAKRLFGTIPPNFDIDEAFAQREQMSLDPKQACEVLGLSCETL